MPSKRNKLLVVLGLLTVAVSKSHNQRFEYEFESSRTSSASHSSANSRQIKPTSKPSTTNYESYLSYYNPESNSNQNPRNVLSRRIFEDAFDQRPLEGKRGPDSRQMQFSKRTGLVQQDSSEISTEIDPGDFYFESQKVIEGKPKMKESDIIIDRRSGTSVTEKASTETKTDIKAEANSNTPIKNTNHEKSVIKDLQKPNESNSTKITKPKRKKVLRVRVRGQNNKNSTKNAKNALKLVEKTKLPVVTTTQKPQLTTKIPEAKIPTEIVPEDLKPKLKFPKISSQADTFQSNKSKNAPEKKTTSEQKLVLVAKKPKITEKKATFTEKKMAFTQKKIPLTEQKPVLTEQKPILAKEKTSKTNAPQVKQFVTFYRRSGPKEGSNSGEHDHYSLPDWTSTFKTDDKSKEDNYYLLSFNYKQNKNGELKDSLRLPQLSTQQKNMENVHETDHYENRQRQTGDASTGELNMHHLEKAAGKSLERQKNAAKQSIFHHGHGGYYLPESDILSSKNQNQAKKVDSIDDLSISDKSFLEKQHSPTVTLKRKETKKQKEPVWHLQPLSKKISNNARRQVKPTPSTPEKDTFFNTQFQNIKHKTSNDDTNFYARSFMKLPSGDKVNIDYNPFIKDDFKEVNVKRTPFKPLENKGDGNYFIHMYKKVGNIEDFHVQAGRIPENIGYLSSLKLSWTDDDKRAKVEEAVDSRSFIPYSTELISSIEDGKDSILTQPSESLMQYKHHYADDFISPLNNDKSYYFHSVPILQRRKRSTATEPQVIMHSNLRNSKTGNNYSLQYKPKLAKRVGLTVNDSVSSTGQSLGEEVKKMPSQYSKLFEPRTRKSYNTSNIFNKYKKPSRDSTNVQIFRSYQTPNRNPKQAQNMTYFLKNKNMSMKLRKTDKVRTRRMHQPQSKLNSEITVAIMNNFTTSESVDFQSTNVRESYLKPEKEINVDISNETNSKPNLTQEYSILKQHDNRMSELGTNGTEEIASKLMSTTSQQILLTTAAPTVSKADKVMPKINVELKKIHNIRANQTDKTHGAETVNKINLNSTVSFSNTTKTPKINRNRAHRKKGNYRKKIIHNSQKASKVQKRMKNETSTNDYETSKNATKPLKIKPEKTTKSPTSVTIPYGYKIDNINAKTNDASRKTSDIQSRRIDENLDIQTKPKRQDTKLTTATTKIPKTTTTTKISITTTLRPVQQINDKTKIYRSSLAASNIQARRIDEQPEILLKIDKSVSKSVNKPKTIMRKINLIQKKGDLQTNVDELQRASSTQPRQIDDNSDNSWQHPQKYADYDSGSRDFQEAVHHSNENEYGHKNFQGRLQDFHHHPNTDYQENDVGITPQVPYQWGSSLSSHQSHEKDYPSYHVIPKTHFTCRGRAPGYYADLETECQVFHMCHGDGVKHSFLCPNSTIFNQRLLVCDWHNKVLCETAEKFYDVNNQLYLHSPQEEKDYKVQAKNNRILPKNQNAVKYSTSSNGNLYNNPTQFDSQSNSEIEDVPLFIVKHFKEKIPNAEFGKPKSVSKSYSAVIAQENDNINPTYNGKTSRRPFDIHENKQDNNYEPKSEILVQNPFPNSQHYLRDNWNAKEPKTNLRQELSPPTGQVYAFQETPRHSENPVHQKTNNSYSNTKIIIPVINSHNSHYVPNLNQNYNDDDTHVAGRHNGKVIIVNRNKLKPNYDTSESRESADPDSRVIFPDSQAKFLHPIKTTTATQPPHYSKHIPGKGRSPVIQNNPSNQNQGNAEIRVPQYIYPLPGIVQNNDGSAKFNYGYRVANPETIHLDKTRIFKLSPLAPNENLKMDFNFKSNNEGQKQSPEQRIKLRIQEIKSGVDYIGNKVGNILDESDNTFKNVRIFKLNPDGKSGGLEEIRLAPFKFEKQSQSRNSKLPEGKREELEIKVIKNHSRDHKIPHQNLMPNVPQNPRNNEMKTDINSNYRINADENMRPNYRNTNTNVISSTPKFSQKITQNVSPNFKIYSKHTPKTMDNNNNNIQHLSPYSQMIKIVPSTNKQVTSKPLEYKETNIENFPENINKNLSTSALQVENRLNNQNTEIILPSKNAFSSKPEQMYEIKYIPLIKVDGVPKPRTFDFQAENPQSEYKNENSEQYKNFYIPKNLHGKDPSDFIYPDKIILQGPKDPFIKEKHFNLEYPTLENSDFKNNNFHYDNTYENVPVNNGHVNGNSFNLNIPTTYNINQPLIHNTSEPPKNTNDKNNNVVFSKTPTEEINTNDKTPHNTEKSNYQYYDLNKPQPQSPVSTQNSNHEIAFGNSDSKNSNSNLPLELGKNGPNHHSVRFDRNNVILNTKQNSDIKSYYNPADENEVKCRETVDNVKEKLHENSAPKEPLDKSPGIIPVSKIIFKELKRPKYPYIPEKTVPKTADESVQLTSKPVKLFQLQRNTRPSFVRPITAIPVIPSSPEERSNYHPPGIVKEARPTHYFQGQNVKPVVYHQGRQEARPNGHSQRRPVMHHSQERRELRPMRLKHGQKQTIPPARPVHDSRGFINTPKTLVNGKASKYADIEKAAEMKAMLKLKEQKVTSHPPARTRPQGNVFSQQRPEVTVETTSNNSKNSKYSALEREAELKAERMLRSKKQGKQT